MAEYVKVPKEVLESLEAERTAFWDYMEEFHPDLLDKSLAFPVIQAFTSKVWKVANRKWEEVE